MTIIECEYITQLPNTPHVTYTIGRDMSVDDALERFKAKFGEPKAVYRWREYLYVEKA